MSFNRITCISLSSLLAFATFQPVLSHGAEVTVTWTFASNNQDGTPFTDLAGARVYYGTSSSNYTHVIDVPGGELGQQRSFTISNLVDGVTYYLNGTAYSATGLESDFCAETTKVAYSGEPVNQSPRVDAGQDGIVTLPNSIVLEGSATDDGLPDGSTLAYTWSKFSGPGMVTFGTPNAAKTTAAFSSAGQYILELFVTDGHKTGSDRVVIDVHPAPTPATPSNLRIIF